MASNPRRSNPKSSRPSTDMRRDVQATKARYSSTVPAPEEKHNVGALSQKKDVVGFNEKKYRLAKATWNKYVLPISDQFGRWVYEELFSAYPEDEHFFTHMNSSPLSRDLFHSASFKTLMDVRFMNKMKDIMESMEKPEQLNEIMVKLGLYHAKLGVKRKHMDHMQQVIINCIRKAMTFKLQPDEEEALSYCLKWAFSISNAEIDRWHAENPKFSQPPTQAPALTSIPAPTSTMVGAGAQTPTTNVVQTNEAPKKTVISTAAAEPASAVRPELVAMQPAPSRKDV